VIAFHAHLAGEEHTGIEYFHVVPGGASAAFEEMDSQVRHVEPGKRGDDEERIWPGDKAREIDGTSREARVAPPVRYQRFFARHRGCAQNVVKGYTLPDLRYVTRVWAWRAASGGLGGMYRVSLLFSRYLSSC
jgi:hypothetical protein